MEDPSNPQRLPCPECPSQLLDAYLSTGLGRLIGVAVDLEFALQAGVSVGLGDISYAELTLISQIVEERDRYKLELERRPTQRT